MAPANNENTSEGIRRRKSSLYEDQNNSKTQLAGHANEDSRTRHLIQQDIYPRVRVSADVERAPLSDVTQEQDGALLQGIASTNVTSRTWPLSNGSDLLGNAGRAEGVTVSSTTAQDKTRFSPISWSTNRTAMRGHDLQSPHAATIRNPRSSLRHTFFNTRLERVVSGADSVIELEDVCTASGPANGPFDGAKKSSERVAVTALDIEEDVSRPEFNFQGLQGISALPHYENWLREKAARSRISRKIKNVYRRARTLILRMSELPPSKDGRHVPISGNHLVPLIDERTNKPYMSNIIRSSRYTVLNFLPRQLLAQFSKLANFYFLCVSILQMIPGLSTTGTYTTIVPLLFFVGISMAKEGYDDFRRNRLDKEENNRDVWVHHAHQAVEGGSSASRDVLEARAMSWNMTKWKDIRVGDIVKLERDQAAPADLVIIHSSGEDEIAYIETMALDGETNLKSKQAPKALSDACRHLERLAASASMVVVEDPNLDLYNFDGRITTEVEILPITNSEIIYRGSILRNTMEVYGLVIYSGEECKIRMNANKTPRIKAPALQAVVNKVVVVLVFFVAALALFNTVAYEIWAADNLSELWYLNNAGISFLKLFVSHFILFNTLIPLSLYVSLEIIKVFQMLLLNDIDMYDEASDTPLEARTSTINEELGQISYIFTDKTGTLTDNVMKFRKLSVAGTAWLHDVDLRAASNQATELKKLAYMKSSNGKESAFRQDKSTTYGAQPPSILELNSPDMSQQTSETQEGPPWGTMTDIDTPRPELNTAELFSYLQYQSQTDYASKTRMLLLAIALCHTCLPEKQEDDSIGFQAASPDELALVQAAQELGYSVIDRRSGVLTIQTHPGIITNESVIEQYEILDVIEFSSKRKRMSVIVRFPDKSIYVICKGADSVITQLLRLSTLAREKQNDVQRRVSIRRSMEAQQAIARKSEQYDRRASTVRPSLSLPRTSINLRGRPSISSARSPPLGSTIDLQRSNGGDSVGSPVNQDAACFSPRPSTQLSRPSVASPRGYEHFQVPTLMDDAAIMEQTFEHVNDFATEGLRTLLYAYRFVSEDEYVGWKKIYCAAASSLVERQYQIEKTGELIERDFELAGATAIEDKLQDGVPEAIEKLRRAGIKLWMLTGDKRETAINIGHACRLIKEYSTVTILDHERGHIEKHIVAALIHISQNTIAHSVVVVDGHTLSLIDADTAVQKLFLSLATQVDSVICCRASPSQKASLVQSIRNNRTHINRRTPITLAIGDGANDIPMILEASVGIGITGREGMQAARSADYSIARFRFLTKLLLVHGRWNYLRTARYVAATFWKEMVFYLIQALYQRYNGHTGTSLYENWSLSMFNTLFTSLPVIFLGINEQDMKPETLLAVPELYPVLGPKNAAFNFKVYAQWTIMAVVDAVLIFYTMLCVYATFSDVGPSNVTASVGAGTPTDLFPLGNIVFTTVVILVSIKLQIIEMHHRTWLNAVAIGLSVGGWGLWNLILSATYGTVAPYGVRGALFKAFGRDVGWWLCLLCMVTVVLCWEMVVKAGKVGLWPSQGDVYRELEKEGSVRRRFQEDARTELEKGWAVQRESMAAGGEARDVGQAITQKSGFVRRLWHWRTRKSG